MDVWIDYQTPETAWRWQVQKDQLEDKIEALEEMLDDTRDKLIKLERNPPMWHLFNWSA